MQAGAACPRQHVSGAVLAPIPVVRRRLEALERAAPCNNPDVLEKTARLLRDAAGAVAVVLVDLDGFKAVNDRRSVMGC